MSRAEIISILALAISLLSFAFFVYFNYRDRAKIITSSNFYSSSEFGPSRIHIVIVNAGRRPIILRGWGGNDKKGNGVITMLGDKNQGLRLGEHERFEITLEKHDIYTQTPDDEIIFSDLWVEDTLGRHYAIKNAKTNIELLLK